MRSRDGRGAARTEEVTARARSQRTRRSSAPTATLRPSPRAPPQNTVVTAPLYCTRSLRWASAQPTALFQTAPPAPQHRRAPSSAKPKVGIGAADRSPCPFFYPRKGMRSRMPPTSATKSLPLCRRLAPPISLYSEQSPKIFPPKHPQKHQQFRMSSPNSSKSLIRSEL